MPYIKQQHRDELDELILPLINELKLEFAHPGELNYIITKILLAQLHTLPKNYLNLNELVGVLECVKLEFYRRAMTTYEDEKIKENGDVYAPARYKPTRSQRREVRKLMGSKR